MTGPTVQRRRRGIDASRPHKRLAQQERKRVARNGCGSRAKDWHGDDAATRVYHHSSDFGCRLRRAVTGRHKN